MRLQRRSSFTQSWRKPPWTGTFPPPITQAAFRFYSVDATPASATPLAAQDTGITAEDVVGAKWHLRIRIQNTGTTDSLSGTVYKLERRINGGTWGTSSTTSFSPHFVGPIATTELLTGGTGTFIAGEAVEVADTAGAGATQITAGNYTEHVWTLATTSNPGDVIEYRVRRGQAGSESIDFVTFAVTPTVTITNPIIVVPVGQAAETDTAQTVTIRRIYTLGQASETDTAQPITGVQQRTVAVPSAIVRLVPAGMDGVVTDDFNRSNGGIGANWATLADTSGKSVIVSNAAQAPTAATYAQLWTAQEFAADQFVEVDATLGSAYSQVGIEIRGTTDATTGYILFWNTNSGGRYDLMDIVSGDLTSAAGVGTSGTRRLRLQAIGDNITAYVDGEEIFNITDATYASGSVGFITDFTTGTTPIVDNFRAGSIHTASDDFNRSDGGLGSNWATWDIPVGVPFEDPVIVSNVVRGATVEDSYGAYWATDSFDGDQFVEVDATLGADYSQVTLDLRFDSAHDTGYFMEWSTTSGGRIRLYRVNPDDITILFTSTGEGVGASTMRFEADGPALRGYLNGSLVFSETDDSYTDGLIGFTTYHDTGSPSIDNFFAGSLGPSVSPAGSILVGVIEPQTIAVGQASETDTAQAIATRSKVKHIPAYPVIAATLLDSVFAADGPFDYPVGTQIGDLVLIFVVIENGPNAATMTANDGTSVPELADFGSLNGTHVGIFARLFGPTTGDFNVTQTPTEVSNVRVLMVRVTGHTVTNTAQIGCTVGAHVASGTSYNPPGISSGSATPRLWFTGVGSMDTVVPFDWAPSGFTKTIYPEGLSGTFSGEGFLLAHLRSESETVDPAAATITSTSSLWPFTLYVPGLPVLTETDKAIQIATPLGQSRSPVTETDTAQPIRPAHTILVGQASETDTATTIVAGTLTLLTPANSTDVDLADGETFTWDHPGTQTDFAFRRRLPAGEWEWWNGTGWQGTEVFIASATEAVTIGAGDW